MIRKANLFLIISFYVFAGFNHFIDPDFYYPLIPPYLAYPPLINIISGITEIVLGIGLLFPFSRKISAYLIVGMLVSFIPAHIYFIQLGGCVSDGLCVPVWIAWARLILIHPLLVWWVWTIRNYRFSLFQIKKIS